MADPKREILIVVPFTSDDLALITPHFSVHHVVRADLDAIRRLGSNCEVAWTNGTIGLSEDAMALMPRLRMIFANGNGVENIDMGAAHRRGIVVSNGGSSNVRCVADHAFALLLAIVRDVPALDQAVRKGGWDEHRAMRPALYGKRLGILGLGEIGLEFAKRAAGFDLSIAYHNRNLRPDVSYTHFSSLKAMAAEVDFLMVACPGGATTFHLVNGEVLDALGPAGFIVNVARGSVIDTDALVAALQERRIAGAALDVFENEPGVPEVFRALPNVVLTPHLAGSAFEVRQSQVLFGVRNLRSLFAGGKVENVISAAS